MKRKDAGAQENCKIYEFSCTTLESRQQRSIHRQKVLMVRDSFFARLNLIAASRGRQMHSGFFIHS